MVHSERKKKMTMIIMITAAAAWVICEIANRKIDDTESGKNNV